MKKQEDFIEKARQSSRLVGRLGQITGFGLSLVTPMLLLVWGAGWLKARFGVGDWVMGAAIVCGLLTGGMTFYRFVTAEIKRAKGEEEEFLRAREERRNQGGGGHEA